MAPSATIAPPCVRDEHEPRTDRAAPTVTPRISLPTRELLLPAALTALTAVLCGLGLAALPARFLKVAPHWILIAGLGLAAASTVLYAIRTEQLLAPVGLVGLVFLAYFVARPLQLSLSSNGLLHTSYNYYATPVESLLQLSGQEISLYIDTRMAGTFDAAMTRAMVVLVLFFALFFVGYRARIGKRLAHRAARIGAHAKALELRWVVLAWLGLGLLGEAVVFTKIGSLSTVVTQLGTQGNLSVSFTFLVILNFYTAGLILWTCWHAPTTTGGKLLLGAALAELVCFYLILGSRTLVLIPVLLMLVAFNEVVRPVRLRLLLGAVVAGILFSSGYLAVREAAVTEPFGRVIASVPGYAADAQVILNSSPVFDQLFEETNYVPSRSAYRHGGELGQGLLSQVPRIVYPGKPGATDTSFRELIWGDTFLAGRPVGAAGEFYRDFGFPGVIVGALILGVLARGLTGLRSRAGAAEGRELRAALFVVGIVLLYQFLVGSYSIAFGSALELGIPLALALKLFARPA
jgi:hypothetical protein